MPVARIGNSVFPDHCGDDDPKCNKFGRPLSKKRPKIIEQTLALKVRVLRLLMYTGKNTKVEEFKIHWHDVYKMQGTCLFRVPGAQRTTKL